MTQYKKYLLVSVAAVSLISHMAQAATTAAAAGAGSSGTDVAVARGPLAQLTREVLATEFKPKPAADGKFTPDAEQIVVPGGYIYGAGVKMATTEPLIALLSGWEKENAGRSAATRVPVNSTSGIRANIEAMKSALSALLTHDQKVFLALKDVRAGRSIAIKDKPIAFNVAGYVPLPTAKDAQEAVKGHPTVLITPVESLRSLFADLSFFESTASVKDNMTALYAAVLKALTHDQEALATYEATEKANVDRAAEQKAKLTASVDTASSGKKPSDVRGTTGDYKTTVLGGTPDMDTVIGSAVTARTKVLEGEKQALTTALAAATAKAAEEKSALEARIRAEMEAQMATVRAAHDAAVAALEARLLEATEAQSALAAEKDALSDEMTSVKAAVVTARIDAEKAALASVATQTAENEEIRARLAGALAETSQHAAKITTQAGQITYLSAEVARLSAQVAQHVKDAATTVGMFGTLDDHITKQNLAISDLGGTPLPRPLVPTAAAGK